MDALTPEPEIMAARRRRRRRPWLMILLCLLVVAAIGGSIWFWPNGAAEKTAARNRLANQPIPVLVATATRKDVPVYLDGLGTVQASATVTIKAMVDGPLTAVNFTEGQEVHRGDVLAQVDPRPYQATLDNAMAKKAQDEATLANARLDLARQQKLVANNYTSAQQADTARAAVAQLEAQVRQDQAQIDSAQTNLSYTTIRAPIDGRTGIRQVDAGNIVHAGDATGLVVITQLQPISVVFTLPQQNLPRIARAIREGTPTALAMAQDATGVARRVLDTGTLTVLDNQVDATTGTIKLKASFPNQEFRLWPGGFVSVRLQVETDKQAIVIPPAAVQRGPRGSYVFIVNPDNSVKRQAVTLGYEDEQVSVVTQGLNGDEKVVMDGASRLSDTSKVVIAQPAVSGPAAAPNVPTAPGTQRRRAGGEAG